jgi:ribosomal protein S18 acetylase RimI-like enzyme
MASVRQRKWLFFSLFLGLASLFGFTYYTLISKANVSAYDAKTDKSFILRLLRENWYWLTTDTVTTYTDEELEQRYIKRSPVVGFPLEIGVCRDRGVPVGFVTYYKQSFYKGILYLLAVDTVSRGHGYGELLMEYALNNLRKQGCWVVQLITRTSNTNAQQLYNKTGFKEIWRDTGFVRYEKALS